MFFISKAGIICCVYIFSNMKYNYFVFSLVVKSAQHLKISDFSWVTGGAKAICVTCTVYLMFTHLKTVFFLSVIDPDVLMNNPNFLVFRYHIS